MQKFVALVVLGTLALGARNAKSQSEPGSPGNSALAPNGPAGALPELPPPPEGKSTILGGKIRRVDPVRDQFFLDIYGQRPMKILYDERTQVFRDGKKIPLQDLGVEDRAAVQTILDGSDVFAMSIHILSRAAEGTCEGRVLAYNSRTGELEIATAESPQPVRVIVPASAQVSRVGESTFTSGPSGVTDLVPGAIVSATFESEPGHGDFADRVSVFAVPGAAFVFGGKVSFIDMHSGILVVSDPRDGKQYQVSFDPSQFQESGKLRTGVMVTVTATYDGTRYVASEMTVN